MKLDEAARARLEKTLEHLQNELLSMRTSRASIHMVEDIKVEHYGAAMTIKQLASITTPDAVSITISPWDQTATAAIERAIRDDQTLGLNPLSDGKTLHIKVPPLTEERRTHLVKQMNEKVEAARIAIRNVRHEILDKAKKDKSAGSISEDDYKALEKDLSAAIELLQKRIDELAENKKQELLSV